MSDIARKIAAEHRACADYTECLCGDWHWTWTSRFAKGRGYTEHIARVAEAAVRARIAADIRAKADEPFSAEDHWWPGLIAAARIAEGGAS